jgi:pilus assembly protein CpaF
MSGDDLVATVRRAVAGGMSAHGLSESVRSSLPPLGSTAVLAAVDAVEREILGAGPLEGLLADAEVSDVVVNGPGRVWVDRGAGLVDSGVRIDDEETLRALARRLVAAGGGRLDDARPYADARLPDGTRVHAVLPPVAVQGTALSLRVPPRRTFSLDALVAARSLDGEAAVWLRRVVAARVAFVVTGGTGSGKTTVLSALLSEVDPRDRLVLIEDTAELQPRHAHVVRLEARTANTEGAGEVGLDELVRQALRMRPDRLVLGEARGAEVVPLLAALNTGHDGGCLTLHANGAEDVPARVEALAVAAGLSRAGSHAQLAAALRVVVHLRREPGGRRRIAGVAVLIAHDDGIVRAHSALRFHDDGIRIEGGHDVLRRLVVDA